MHAILLRCVFVTLSPLMRALVEETLSSRVQLQILAEYDRRDALVPQLAGLHPDLVVIGLETRESDELATALLGDLPDARLLLMSADGAHAYLRDRRPYRRALTDFSPDQLLEAILEPGFLPGNPAARM